MEDFLDIEEAYKKLQNEYQATLQNLKGYEEAIQKAYLNPETREPLKKIMKQVAGIEIDDPVYEKPIKEEINKLSKKLETIEAEKRELEARKQQEEVIKVFNEYGLTDEDLKQLPDFIKKTGVVPTTLEGWRVVAQNYQRSKIAKPTHVASSTLGKRIGEDWIKNPKEKFKEAHLRALGLM